MIIILRVKAPMHMAQAVKESIAMHLERFGDTKVLQIRPEEEQTQEQMTFGQIYPTPKKQTQK